MRLHAPATAPQFEVARSGSAPAGSTRDALMSVRRRLASNPGGAGDLETLRTSTDRQREDGRGAADLYSR